MGNPPYPGWTSANGPNWVDYLTFTSNASLLLTYNLAYGGATIDTNLAPAYLPTVISMTNQTLQEFLPLYAPPTEGPPPQATWDPSTTLFTIFEGINDVGVTYNITANDNYTLPDTLMTKYISLVDTMYTQGGARNFLFLNTPPVDRSPLTQFDAPKNESSPVLEALAVARWNGQLQDLAQNLACKYYAADEEGVNVFLFDTHTLFGAVMDNPGQFEATSGYRNTTHYCEAYAMGTENGAPADPACGGLRAEEYLWLNSLHPTSPWHELLAQEVAALLEKGPNVKCADDWN